MNRELIESKLEDLLAAVKLNDILKKNEVVEVESKKKCNVLLICLAIIGAIAAIAGIAYAVYRYFTPDYLDDFDDDFDDDDFEDSDFEDEFEDEEVK